MNVLGISAEFVHDSGAALVKDGKLVAAAEEERFSRKKHDYSAPLESIKFCLNQANLTMDQIDFVAVPWLPFSAFSYGNVFSWLSRGRDVWPLGAHFLLNKGLNSAVKLWKSGKNSNQLEVEKLCQGTVAYLSEQYLDIPEVKYFEHHKAHAANAFYCSGFDDASVISVDGNGEANATVVWNADGNSIEKVREELCHNSLGMFYLTVTNFLGLGRFGEGKTMGLAAYGKKNKSLEKRIREKIIDTEKPEWYKLGFPSLTYESNAINKQVLGFPSRTNESPLGKNYADFAFASQKALEKAVSNIAEWAVEKTGRPNLCLSGGVALNCLANSVAMNSHNVNGFFAFPAANDGGTPVGAALLCAAEHGEKVKHKMEHAYFGPAYSNKEIENLLKKIKADYTESRDISGEVAELLAKNRIVGWFQGRMELGPRALGNRSILSNPTKKSTKDKVNKLKGREFWRPLAPSMPDEAKEEYLEAAVESPFMILSFNIRKEKLKEIPSASHVDGSTRPQTVKKKSNPKYHRLIKEFEGLTSVPVVLNTSFNLKHEPIVCSPLDAVRTFYSSTLDAAAIGDFLLLK